MVKWGIAFVKTRRVYSTFNVSKLRKKKKRKKQEVERSQEAMWTETRVCHSIYKCMINLSERAEGEVLKEVTLEIRNICKTEGKRTSPKHCTIDKGDTALKV